MQMNVWCMPDIFQNELCLVASFQTNNTNANYLWSIIFIHLQHTKITWSIRWEKILSWSNMETDTTINKPTRIIIGNINQIFIINYHKIICSIGSNMITILIILVLLFVFVVIFQLITKILKITFFATIVALKGFPLRL